MPDARKKPSGLRFARGFARGFARDLAREGVPMSSLAAEDKYEC